MSTDVGFFVPFALKLGAFIEFTWWDVYLIAWIVGGPAVLLSLLVLWGAPRWLDFERPRWLWSVVSLVLFVPGPVGVLWVTLAVTPSGFLGRRHAYGTLEYLAYQWGPGLATLPPVILAGVFAWRRWGRGRGRDGRDDDGRGGA